MDEAEIRPGRGAWRLVERGERIPGGREEPIFLGRGRSNPAPENPHKALNPTPMLGEGK